MQKYGDNTKTREARQFVRSMTDKTEKRKKRTATCPKYAEKRKSEGNVSRAEIVLYCLCEIKFVWV